jgi:hypothetical protein
MRTAVFSFEGEVAEIVGTNAAVIAYNIKHWCIKNEANKSETHFHEGRYWTFNSVAAFNQIFYFMTPKQIRTALNKLVESGVIVAGIFNEAGYDRTKWYSYEGFAPEGTSICHEGQTDLPLRANGIAPEGKPIPDINTNINTDINADAVFEFWNEKAKGIKSWTVHKRLTRKFRDMINARINEHSGEDVIAFINALSRQSWATNGKFPSDTLEYACRPGTFAKHFDKLTNPQNQSGALPQASVVPMGQKETIDELLAKRDAERSRSAEMGGGQNGDAPADMSGVQSQSQEETLEMFERDPRGLEDARLLSSL